MFRECVTETPFTGEVADSFFPNIGGDSTSFGSDVSFLSTLRALVSPRLGEGDKLSLFIGSNRPSKGVANDTINDMFAKILPEFMFSDPANRLVILDVCLNEEEKTKEFVDKINRHFPKKFDGFIPLEKTVSFYRNAFPIAAFMNPEIKTSILFVGGIDYRRLHYLQCSIAVSLPWYIPDGKCLSPEEKTLVKSLIDKENGYAAYTEALAELGKVYNFKQARIDMYLTGIENVIETNAIQILKSSVANEDSRIDDLIRSLNDSMARREDSLRRLYAYENHISSTEDNGIRDFFSTNKNLVFERVSGSKIYYGTLGYLSLFDRGLAERTIANRNSIIYEGKDKHTCDDLKKFMQAVFVDETIRIRMCAKFELDISGYINDNSMANFEEPEFANCLPNPHLAHHSCLGENRPAVVECLRRGDYIGAIQQTFACTQNLALTDTTVVRSFMRDITRTGAKFRYIELPDGTFVDYKEAVEWLKREEASDVKEEKKGEA